MPSISTFSTTLEINEINNEEGSRSRSDSASSSSSSSSRATRSIEARAEEQMYSNDSLDSSLASNSMDGLPLSRSNSSNSLHESCGVLYSFSMDDSCPIEDNNNNSLGQQEDTSPQDLVNNHKTPFVLLSSSVPASTNPSWQSMAAPSSNYYSFQTEEHIFESPIVNPMDEQALLNPLLNTVPPTESESNWENFTCN